jgi:hypothetical protein
LGILSNKAINDYAGPDYYHWDVNSGRFSDSDTNKDQSNIYAFMTYAAGLAIPMSSPTADSYLGLSSAHQTAPDETVLVYNSFT